MIKFSQRINRWHIHQKTKLPRKDARVFLHKKKERKQKKRKEKICRI